ncbi:hypothetical protein ACN20G_08810 [Streptomyces sp. BI20]|uniref:hypothetical protein n=1 Tax=Streptomyces sp. BI20 TaxID=3403460 RepID=UPI003C793483
MASEHGGSGPGTAPGPISIGSVTGSAFSIGGAHVRNEIARPAPPPGPAPAGPPTRGELLKAVLALRTALVEQAPRGPERAALEAELDAVADALETDAEATGDGGDADGEAPGGPDGGPDRVRPGIAARLRAALVRWTPLIETVSAATTLAGLLVTLGS